MAKLDIYSSDNIVVEQIDLTDQIVYTHGLMQEHKIVASNVISADKLDIQIGDFIIFREKKYTINTVPDVVADHRYNYTITFEGPEYSLYDKLFMDNGDADFTFYGNPASHLQLVVDNINQIDPGWTVGFVDDATEEFITYVGLTCRVALSTIAEKFKLEYSFANKEINLKKQAGNTTTLIFKYGMFNGLYSLSRKSVSEKNVKTRIFGYGSTQNLPAGYRTNAKRLVFEERSIANNINIYGEKQISYTNDTIYPRREGTVTAASPGSDSTNLFTVTDTSLDFNINDLGIPGKEAKISFITGELSGEDPFVIDYYNNATKTITFKQAANGAGIKLPNATFSAAVGDKYVLLDIGMPQSYITAAEAELKADTLLYAAQISIPQVEYDLNLDILHVKSEGYELTPGDKVTVQHEALGIDTLIRVTQVNFPITFPDQITNNTKYTATIANFISYTVSERLVAATIENRSQIRIVDRRSIELARRNTADYNDLKELTFDPDGYFDPGNIKPESIETGMLSIGSKSQNFILRDVLYQPNYLGNQNTLLISAGILEHLVIEIPSLGYSWVINSKTFSGLDPLKPYYVYAKCSKTALTGEWMISEVPVFADETPGFFNFNLGILYKVRDGYRNSDMTYGATTIVGDNITTGRVQDITKQNYLDLKTAQFNLGPANGDGIDWDVTNAGKLTIRGALVQSGSGIVSPLPVYRGPYVPGATYYKGETVLYDGTQWIFVNDVPTAGQTPADNNFWDIYASKGTDGGTGSSIEIQYSPDASNWHAAPFVDGDIYMRQRVGTGAFSAAIRIVGEEGAPGEDGQYTSYQFAKNTSLTVAPTTGFTDAPPTINTNEFLWMRIGTFEAGGAQIGVWSNPVRISGPQGVPGVDGPPGADGQSLYTWVKYADNESGAGLSDSPIGKDYIGYAYNKPTPSESNVPGDYAFAKYRGDQGIPGGTGPNGESLYTWLKYADTPTTGMSDLPEGKDYFGIAYNKTIQTESNNYSDYQWSKTAGEDGVGAFTLVNQGGMTIAGSTVVKTGGGTAWDSAVRSLEGFTNGAILSFQVVTNNAYMMIALNDDPDGNNNYDTLEYAFYFLTDGTLRIWESNVEIGDFGGYAGNDKFSIQYDGKNIIYTKNGAVLRTVTTTSGRTFYLDSSFLTPGGSVKNITFAASGANGVSAFTLVNQGGMQIAGNTATKISQAGGWDSAIRSVEGYVNGAVVSFQAVDNTKSLMMALNSDPGTNNSFETLDYAIFLTPTGGISIFESGSEAGFFGSYAGNDKFSIQYDGKNIIYIRNGAVLRTIASTQGRIFYLDSSFDTPGSSVTNISFSAAGARGADGANGTNGSNGAPGANGNYTEFRFQKNGSTTSPPSVTNVADPSGWTIEQPATGIGEYLWMISAVKSGVTNNLITNWSTPVRTTSKDGTNGNDGAPGAPGTPGANGTNGAQGPFITYTGNYDAGKTYVGSATQIQATKYNGVYYVSRVDAGSFSGVLPTDTSKWNSIGAQFDSVATGLLLAQAATIDNLTVRNVKTSDTGRRLEIIGADNRMTYYGLVAGTGAEYEALRIADNIDTQATGQSTGGIKVFTPSGDQSYLSGNGVFSNGSGTLAVTTSSGLDTNGSIVGMLQRRNSTSPPYGISAAVFGIDASTTGNSASYGMASFGSTLLRGGVVHAVNRVGAGYVCTKQDYIVVVSHSATTEVSLPNNPEPGRTLQIFNRATSGTAQVNVYYLGNLLRNIGVGGGCIFFYSTNGAWDWQLY